MSDTKPRHMYSVKLRKIVRCDRSMCVSFVSIGMLFLVLFYLCVSYSPLAVSSQRSHETFYGIIFDAGSTGSRIHIFELSKAGSDAPAELVKETFKAIKPGLSSFADNPKRGVEKTLKPLLDLAAETIPRGYHQSTLLALKATAGLRLLPADSANKILREVRKLFSRYDFLFHKDGDDIAIMKGTDEGIYMWVTVNFLLGALSCTSSKVSAKVVTMDLGGGSTQLTFVPTEYTTLKFLPAGKIQSTRIFNQTYELYSQSYLGLGLMAVRLTCMGHNTARKLWTSATVDVLTSPCLPANYVGNWSMHTEDLIIRGLEPGQAGYENCYEQLREFIQNQNITSIPELQHHPVYIFSYYFDRAVDASIISTETGTTITPSHYRDAAKYVCNGHSITGKPYLCFDLTYIYALLTDGFGLLPTSQLYIYKKINNIEMSWALGSMFGLMSADEKIRL